MNSIDNKNSENTTEKECSLNKFTKIGEKTKKAVKNILNLEEKKDSSSRELMELTALLNSSLSIDKIKTLTIENVTKFFEAEAGSLLFYDKENEQLYFDIAIGEKGEGVKTIRLDKGQGIAGKVAETREPLLVNDVQKQQNFYQQADKKTGFKTKNMICSPVEAKGELLGVVQIINKKRKQFTQSELNTLTGIANNVGMALENARAYEILKENTFSMISSLSEIIGARDEYTGGHTQRVMSYCYEIAEQLGVEDQEKQKLLMASLLHDIGKIGIKDEILLKPAGLTDEEFATMKTHSSIGGYIISNLSFLQDVAPIVRGHHERYDGNGYPDGIKGEDMDINTKIICVADAFDAMTTNRPYKKSFSIEKATKILKENKGTQFAPEAVDAFLEVLQSKDINTIKDSEKEELLDTFKVLNEYN